MHITDGMLTVPVMVCTNAVAAGGVAVGLRKMDDALIPRVGVLSSAFFVASLIHIPVGVTSVHLVLNGLVGLLLGWAAFPAIAVALFLQALLFSFGGYTSLGANLLLMGIPAVVCHGVCRPLIDRGTTPRSVAVAGFLGGFIAVVLSCALFAAILLCSGGAFKALVVAMVLAHLPVALTEGFVTASVVVFLFRVRPELICRQGETP